MWLFLALVAVPLIEIALFIQVGGLIGLWPTLATVVLTALIGAVLLRRQGLAQLAALRGRLREGGDPLGPLAHGALILVAGVLLLTPGFFTDSVGLALLVPQVRARAIRALGRRIVVMRAGGAGGAAATRPAREQVVEGEWREVPGDGGTGPGPAARSGDGRRSGWTRRE